MSQTCEGPSNLHEQATMHYFVVVIAILAEIRQNLTSR